MQKTARLPHGPDLTLGLEHKILPIRHPGAAALARLFVPAGKHWVQVLAIRRNFPEMADLRFGIDQVERNFLAAWRPRGCGAKDRAARKRTRQLGQLAGPRAIGVCKEERVVGCVNQFLAVGRPRAGVPLDIRQANGRAAQRRHGPKRYGSAAQALHFTREQFRSVRRDA